MSDFKNVPFGKMTPEVLLAQAMEVKWQGVILIGILADVGAPGGSVPLGFNVCGLSDLEFSFLVRSLDVEANRRASPQKADLKPSFREDR